MTNRITSSLIVVSMLLVASASSLQAQQQRKRTARTASDTATLIGVATDSVDGSAVFDAIITVGKKTFRAGADGRFSVPDLAAGSTVVSFSRWGYEPKEQTIALQRGSNTMNASLTPKPSITVVDKQQKSYRLDYETSGIASRGPLSGGVLIEPVDFCQGNGEVRDIEKSRMASLSRSTAAFDKTKCCSDGAGVVFKVTLKGGESFDALVRDCLYYAVDFIGRDRKDGKSVYINLSDVESVTFPQ